MAHPGHSFLNVLYSLLRDLHDFWFFATTWNVQITLAREKLLNFAAENYVCIFHSDGCFLFREIEIKTFLGNNKIKVWKRLNPRWVDFCNFKHRKKLVLFLLHLMFLRIYFKSYFWKAIASLRDSS